MGFLDQFLGWAVIAFPFLLSILFVFIPARAEDEKRHMKWRYVLVGVGAIFSLLAWWQQERSLQAAKKDRDAAVKQTSDQVTKSVTEALGNQYKELINSLTTQIGELKGQLTVQGKDVNLIKSSNIVTGKNPVRVEVTNPGTPDGGPPKLSVFEVGPTTPNPAVAAHEKTLLVVTDKAVSPVRMTVQCDGGLENISPWILGSSGLMGSGIMKLSPKSIQFGIDSPAFTPKSPLRLSIYYNEDRLEPCTVSLQ
jgi:hypothetical protein